MFIGRYYHKLEEKGRISLPKSLRGTDQNWVITRGLDGGLFLFKAESFEAEIEKLALKTFTKKNDRDFIRYMTNDAYALDVDKNGRVLLPEYLINFAKISKDVVIVGSYNKIEIWDMDKYHEYLDQMEQRSEEIAESINED